ncbi:MAG: hypothetical protein JWP89_3817 [Schlesneria sp.]|nr:hypothetical protein [Schlesneria sp.]
MTEVDMQALRDRLDREEERLREERQVLRRDHKYQAALFDSLALSEKVGRLGLIPSVAWLTYALCTSSMTTAADILVFGTISAGFVYYGAPYAGSFAAHFWFRDSNMSTPLVAAAFTLLVETAYLGWVIILTR